MKYYLLSLIAKFGKNVQMCKTVLRKTSAGGLGMLCTSGVSWRGREVSNTNIRKTPGKTCFPAYLGHFGPFRTQNGRPERWAGGPAAMVKTSVSQLSWAIHTKRLDNCTLKFYLIFARGFLAVRPSPDGHCRARWVAALQLHSWHSLLAGNSLYLRLKTDKISAR